MIGQIVDDFYQRVLVKSSGITKLVLSPVRLKAELVALLPRSKQGRIYGKCHLPCCQVPAVYGFKAERVVGDTRVWLEGRKVAAMSQDLRKKETGFL